MQDRFKFRTYIPDKKFFKLWGWIKKGEYKGLCSTGDYSLDELLEKYTNHCTGLKDKNGKLIYEGDIVLGSWKTKLIVIYDVFSSRFMLRTIKEHTAEIAYYTYFDTQGENIYCKNLEILGNIYENPELLVSEEE